MDERGIISRAKITALKAAIQSKTGTTGGMTIDQMTEAVRNMSTGGKPFQVPIGFGVEGSWWSVTGDVTAEDILEHLDNIELVASGVVYHYMGCTYTGGTATLAFSNCMPVNGAMYVAAFKLVIENNEITSLGQFHYTFQSS